jgi:hypothetical protein
MGNQRPFRAAPTELGGMGDAFCYRHIAPNGACNLPPRQPGFSTELTHLMDTERRLEPPCNVISRMRNRSKLSWEETAKAMAAAKEDWSEWEFTSAGGLSQL